MLQLGKLDMTVPSVPSKNGPCPNFIKCRNYTPYVLLVSKVDEENNAQLMWLINFISENIIF